LNRQCQNVQPWHFIVARDPVRALSGELGNYTREFIAGVPIAVVLDHITRAMVRRGRVRERMMLAARSQAGSGTAWYRAPPTSCWVCPRTTSF